MFDWKVKDIKATNAIFLGDKTEEEGRPFKARFLQAGLVKYDFGVCLLKKETIDRFVNTFIDCPVIINHKDDIKKDDKQGTIKSIWFAPEDGWFWCSGVLDDEAAKKVEKDGFNVSCQYRITEYSNNTENKLHNGNHYDKEILNGVFEHLAIVKTPRYEDAYIAVNAIMATNEDKWITIGAGEDKKGRHVLVKDGQTKEEAVKEKLAEWEEKGEKKEEPKKEEKQYTWNDKKYTAKELIEQGFKPMKYSGSIYENGHLTYLEKEDKGKLHRVKISEDEYREAAEHNQKRKAEELNKAKEQAKTNAKNLTEFVKWQYNVDIEPYITREANGKTLVDWEKMPRETQAALKKLASDSKINLDEYSGFEKSIDVKDKKIFDALEKHRQSDKPEGEEGNNIIDKHFKQEYKHYNGDAEPTKELDAVRKSMANIDKGNYSDKDIININRYINEAESADFKEFADEMRKKYKDLPLETNKEYFNREREDKKYNPNTKEEPKAEEKEETIESKIEKYSSKIPKAYRRDNKTKALWLYKNSYITRSEFENEMKASNSFLDSFKDFIYNKLTEEFNDRLGELTASNEERWITIHPHGKSEDGENDYRRLKIEDGETIEDAMHRQGYYDKRKVNDELKKKVEEKIKALEEKAKKVGGDQTVLGRKYLAEAEALRKGLTSGEEKKPEDKKPENKQSLLPHYASDFIDKTKKQKEAREKWHNLLIEYQDKAKTDKKMLEFEQKKDEILSKMREIKTYNYEYQQLINEKNKILDAKRAYEKEFFGEVYAAQKEYDDLNTIGDKKDIITKMSNDIKAQISKISEKHNDLVKSINKIDFSEFEKLKKQDKDFEKEQNEVYEKMREIGREVGYNDPRISEYRAIFQEYAVKRGKIKKQQKELQYKKALEVGKLLQVKNGVKLDTKNSPAMQDITNKLKECLDGVIPSTNFNNAKMTVKKHEGRAYQSGSTINISANEEIGTAIHETMHHLEEHSEHVLMNSLAFATSRTVGDKQESLKRLTGLGYKANEVCKKDKFFNPYCGKLYDVFGGRDKNFVASYASEIMSMGVQELFTNPQEFAKNDREYFDFVVANLKGELWS